MFKCGMPAMRSCVWTLGPQLVALLGRIVEHLGCGDCNVSQWGEVWKLNILVIFPTQSLSPECSGLNENGPHKSIY